MHEDSAPNSVLPRIRIAHLITGLNVGGAERQLKHLVLASDRGHFEHIVISMMGIGSIGEDLRAAGVEVHSLGMPRGKPTLAGLVRLRRFLRQSKPDILHCWLYHSCLLGVLAGRLARVPKVVWSLRSANESLLRYRFQTRVVVRLCAILSRLPNAIIPNSEAGRSLHERWGYSKSRMQMIPNGVDLDLFRPNPAARSSVREELDLPSGAILIGLFARYHPVKDHDTFFRAAQMLASRQPNTHFVLAGDGVTAGNPELSGMVRECGLQGVVHFLGPRCDIPRLTAALDIACLSSWSESSPSVLCEAMACGVPCATTDVGDARLIVGDTGRVAPPRNPRALAAALLSLLEMPGEQRTAIGQRARKHIQESFGLTSVASAFESLYQALVRHRDPRANFCVAVNS